MQMLLSAAEMPAPVLGIFYPGELVGFLMIVSLLVLINHFVRRATSGQPMPPIRKIPGLEAIDESVGRATEMGKPVLYNLGSGGVSSADTIASWPILAHVAKVCATYDTRLVSLTRNYLVYGVTTEIVRQAYLEAGKPDIFNENDVRWYTDSQWSYAMGTVGFMEREKPAANIMLGNYAAEALVLAEAGAVLEIVQIAATSNVIMVPFFVASCDYTLLGEELYAASAYLSKEPVLVASVVVQDYVKLTVGLLILVGSVLATANAGEWLVKLLSY